MHFKIWTVELPSGLLPFKYSIVNIAISTRVSAIPNIDCIVDSPIMDVTICCKDVSEDVVVLIKTKKYLGKYESIQNLLNY